MSTGVGADPGTELCPGPGYLMIGEGRHSVVWRRPGSPRVMQLFRRDCVGLNLPKLRREYVYLRKVFAVLPRLIPRQRLYAPTGTPLGRAVMIKQWVDVDPQASLIADPAPDLPEPARQQLVAFLRIVHGLLDDTAPDLDLGTDATLLPDIIDPPLQNLVVDTDGNLRLIDTNRLISTAALRQLHAAGATIDLDRHPIHALALRRMMFLESRYLGRAFEELIRDPVYTRYLTPPDLHTLVAASAAVGEPVRYSPTGSP